tara:strand:- start:201 stop:1109 length:909 start_codon:yes stop_codon:yes gene_type:complete
MSFILHFLGPLRSRSAVIHPVIVILCPKKPDVDVLHIISMFEEVYLVIGSPGNHLDLLRAGMHRCAHITFMSDKTQSFSDEYLADMDKVFMARKVDQHNSNVRRRQKKKKAPAALEKNLIQSNFEFRYFSNLQFVKPIKPAVDRLPNFCMEMVKCRPCRSYMEYVSDTPPVVSLEPMVASGRVWLTEVLIKQLIPLWQTKGSFLHILQLLLHVSGTPEQLITTSELQLLDCPPQLVGQTFMEAFFSFANKQDSIIVIGLYRKAVAKNGFEFNYVYTNPARDTVLKDTDSLYLLVNYNSKYQK